MVDLAGLMEQVADPLGTFVHARTYAAQATSGERRTSPSTEPAGFRLAALTGPRCGPGLFADGGGSVNPTGGHMEAALEGRVTGGSLEPMSKDGGSSHEVTRLIDRIRTLVAEQRRLDGRGRAASSGRRRGSRLPACRCDSRPS